ncbi:hypothetical protein ACHAXT_004736 [Thalassiosira profunda]
MPGSPETLFGGEEMPAAGPLAAASSPKRVGIGAAHAARAEGDPLLTPRPLSQCGSPGGPPSSPGSPPATPTTRHGEFTIQSPRLKAKHRSPRKKKQPSSPASPPPSPIDPQPEPAPGSREDPAWAVLDPNESDGEKTAPLRVGVTYVLPPELYFAPGSRLDLLGVDEPGELFGPRDSEYAMDLSLVPLPPREPLDADLVPFDLELLREKDPEGKNAMLGKLLKMYRPRIGRAIRERMAKEKEERGKEKARRSKAANIAGVDKQKQEEETDFTKQKSIRQYFPYYKGKGRRDVPLLQLKKLSSAEAKAKFCRDWRNMTEAQQDAEKARFKKEKAAEVAREAKEKERAKNAKKRATVARRAEKAAAKKAAGKRKREEEADEKQRQRDLRRNDGKRQRRAAEKENAEPPSGLISNGAEAAKKSAASKSLKSKGKERGATDKPTEPKHLTNKTVRRMSKSAPRATMRLQKVVNLSSVQENEKYYVNQTVVTFNVMADPPKVGGSKSKKKGKKRRPKIDIEVVTTDPEGFSKQQQLLMLENGLLPHVVEKIRQDIEAGRELPAFPSTPDNVRKINTEQQFVKYHGEAKAKRKKANSGGKSKEDVEDSLGDKVKRAKRKLW